VPLPLASDQAPALADGLLVSLQETGEVPADSLAQLCALAIADDPAVARAASVALFRNIIEPLGDRFEPVMADMYVRFFSGVIDYCRRQPAFGAFDRQLGEFGLNTNQQLLDRAARVRMLTESTPATLLGEVADTRKVRQPSPLSNAVMKRVKKIFVPSRVTLGADIAVTSVILSRMKTLFPNARMALLGGAKAGLLFASDARVELVETAYPRGGTLRERLNAWVALCQSVAEQLEGMLPDEYMIVDPDSRLTQLGLLPLEADDSRYYFFESRSYSLSEDQPLALLTGCWLDEVLGPERIMTRQAARRPPTHGSEWGYNPEYPYVALPAEDLARGKALKSNMRGPLAAVNLGVGGNAAKRVDDPFELEMLMTLLKAGYTLVLDRGAGEEELERTARLIAMLQGQDKTVSEAPPVGGDVPAADVFVWEGSLSGFGGLIASADLYCGYDSAGGHLAAALGIPVIDIFTDASPPRLRERWTPWGEKPVQVITAERSKPRMALYGLSAALRELAR
jgi:ADP-heptose:LPS heptosyltransferase